jgi:hypothetical protein
MDIGIHVHTWAQGHAHTAISICAYNIHRIHKYTQTHACSLDPCTCICIETHSHAGPRRLQQMPVHSAHLLTNAHIGMRTCTDADRCSNVHINIGAQTARMPVRCCDVCTHTYMGTELYFSGPMQGLDRGWSFALLHMGRVGERRQHMCLGGFVFQVGSAGLIS